MPSQTNIEVEKTASNQHNSVVSSTTDETDEDGRVGRRSELIRLRRNQEMQSLIGKGLIKNKRAIFEQQAQQQQQQQNNQPPLTRRSSGAMITQRINAFKSLDSNSSTVTSSINDSVASNKAINKITTSFADRVSLDENRAGGNSISKTSTPITVKREFEPVVLTRGGGETPEPKLFFNDNTKSDENDSVRLDENDSVKSDQHNTVEPDDRDIVKSVDQDTSRDSLNESSATTMSSPKQVAQLKENGADQSADEISPDENGNSENSFSKDKSIANDVSKANTTNEVITNEELIMNGKNSNIQALALFDYQAADNTEISFDPDDKIGHIQKVDPGWWHGQVMSGRFKGQIGLFPANYVQEIEPAS